MKLTRLDLVLAAGLVLLLSAPAQSQFVKTLGGTGDDYGYSVIEASDGGFVVTGWTVSFGAGGYDFLLVKFDSSGNHLWTRTLGGSDQDVGRSLIQASDGGLVVAGYSESFGAGYRDFIVAKFDSSGNHLWTRTLGGTADDIGLSVIETSDEGFVVAGRTESFGAGQSNLLLAKFDSSGNHLWTRTLGGNADDVGMTVIQASDGGLVVTGWTVSFGAGGYDFLLAKFDSSGNHLWTRTLGGTDLDEGETVIQASDGGLVVAGYSQSFGAGYRDFIVAKFDSSGNHLWTRTLGGNAEDRGKSVIQASDGGLLVTGYSNNFDAGGYDLFLAKFDALGNHLWTRTLGGNADEMGISVIQASNGGLVVTGGTYSFGAGSHDLLFAKFDASGNTCLGEFVTPTVTSPDPTITSPDPTITSPGPTITSPDPTITSPDPTLTIICEVSPSIISIGDVGNDQGRQVRVKWDCCYYDATESPVMITEYSLWRRIGEDKGGYLADLGVFDGGRVYPPGDWDFIKTVPARAESTYSTVCPTLGDSTLAEGMYWSVFFVSAMTADPLVYFDSDPDSGYSLDNIPPLPIFDLEIDPNSWFTLQWTVPGEYVGEKPISAYDIRYSTDPVGADTQAWWDNAQACTGEGFFNLTVGEKDSFRVAGETGCHPELYFAVKGLDDRPNASGISNVVHFLCGDDNGDEIVNVGDIVYEVSYLFRNGPAPSPRAAGDVNCDGIENVGDIVYKVSYLYRGGPPPCGQ